MAAAAQQEATCLSDTNAEVGKQGTSEDGLLQHMDEQEHWAGSPGLFLIQFLKCLYISEVNIVTNSL